MSEIDKDTFRIETPEQAAWAMRKYRALAQKAARNDDLAKAEHLRIDSWLERANGSIEANMDFFYRHLEAYAMKERHAGRKSVDLPDGTIKTRVKRAGIAPDKSTFVQWALEQERHDLLRTSYAPDMDAITSAVVVDGGTVLDPTTGEVIPGLAPTPESVSVSVNPDLTAADLEEDEDE